MIQVWKPSSFSLNHAIVTNHNTDLDRVNNKTISVVTVWVLMGQPESLKGHKTKENNRKTRCRYYHGTFSLQVRKWHTSCLLSSGKLKVSHVKKVALIGTSPTAPYLWGLISKVYFTDYASENCQHVYFHLSNWSVGLSWHGLTSINYSWSVSTFTSPFYHNSLIIG